MNAATSDQYVHEKSILGVAGRMKRSVARGSFYRRENEATQLCCQVLQDDEGDV